MKHYSALPTIALDSSHATGFGQLDINNYAGARHREGRVEWIPRWLCYCWLKVCLSWPTEGKQLGTQPHCRLRFSGASRWVNECHFLKYVSLSSLVRRSVQPKASRLHQTNQSLFSPTIGTFGNVLLSVAVIWDLWWRECGVKWANNLGTAMGPSFWNPCRFGLFTLRNVNGVR